jgi:Ca-activated chloride channel family protein
MQDNDGWTGVKQAAAQVFDPDQAARNFLQTHPQDVTTVTIFNGGITGGSPWTVNGNNDSELHGLTEKVTGYQPNGETNMYGCLLRAAAQLGDPKLGDRKRLVVLMTDGKSSQGERTTALDALRAASVPVIAIAFGKDADPTQLTEVAQATSGAFFKQNDLVAALRQAAGYK